MIQPHHLHTHGPEPLYNVVKAEKSCWTRVEDAMPATDDDVLVWNGAYCDIANAYDDDEEGRVFLVDSPESRKITHWMPLPKAPKEAK